MGQRKRSLFLFQISNSHFFCVALRCPHLRICEWTPLPGSGPPANGTTSSPGFPAGGANATNGPPGGPNGTNGTAVRPNATNGTLAGPNATNGTAGAPPGNGTQTLSPAALVHRDHLSEPPLSLQKPCNIFF